MTSDPLFFPTPPTPPPLAEGAAPVAEIATLSRRQQRHLSRIPVGFVDSSREEILDGASDIASENALNDESESARDRAATLEGNNHVVIGHIMNETNIYFPQE